MTNIDILVSYLCLDGLFGGLGGFQLLLRLVIEGDAGYLDDADHSEEEVYGGETVGVEGRQRLVFVYFFRKMGRRENIVVQVVLGLDDQAPSGPDETGRGEGGVLCEGELLGGARKVRDTG